MSTARLVCAMCGHAFDPDAHPACGACPLQRGCQLVCCPACGYENVDIRRSVLARLADRWLSLRHLPSMERGGEPASRSRSDLGESQ